MELEISRQASCLLWGLLWGMGLGIEYRLLKKGGVLRDAFFALSAFAAAFVYGQAQCFGRLGLWELAALSTGFWFTEKFLKFLTKL